MTFAESTRLRDDAVHRILTTVEGSLTLLRLMRDRPCSDETKAAIDHALQGYQPIDDARRALSLHLDRLADLERAERDPEFAAELAEQEEAA